MTTTSMLALTPEAHASGAGASTDTPRPIEPDNTIKSAVYRISRRLVCDYDPGPEWKSEEEREREHALLHDHSRDYDIWLHHVTPAAGCTRPIQIRGTSHTIDAATGEILDSRHTGDHMPDGVIYTACGNRRATVCPSCAETYRADTYQLIKAGLVGGKGVPDTVTKHPAVFVTFTAPSFGIVHTRASKKGEPGKPCRPRRRPQPCPHGVDMRCFAKHRQGEKAVGKPLCMDCYDYHGQVVWNVMAGELWRRTMEKVKSRLFGDVYVSYAKVAELQARGAAHFHALFRLDNDLLDEDGAVLPPSPRYTHHDLADAIRNAVATTSFTTLPHPDRLQGWRITWGEQLDIRPIRLAADGAVTETQVAGYLAKYATKSTEEAGHSSRRITPETIDLYTTRDGHIARIIAACWRLGRPGCNLDPEQAAKNSRRLSYRRLRRWAHMLGFGGHFSTKSRNYSTTLRALREARTIWRRQHHRSTDHVSDDETTLIVGHFTYSHSGWHATGDALLANTAAAKAREHRRVAKEEYADLEALDLI